MWTKKILVTSVVPSAWRTVVTGGYRYRSQRNSAQESAPNKETPVVIDRKTAAPPVDVDALGPLVVGLGPGTDVEDETASGYDHLISAPKRFFAPAGGSTLK